MQQRHPLYGQDRPIVDRLLAASDPSDADITDCARLLMRYIGYPGAVDIQEDLARTLVNWHLDADQLYARSRAIWASGYRPALADDEVGSGADVNAA
jgi:hypothetical protein